ncbi:MAG: CehA/McbA family metallohydrolase [Kluyvera sp.]
MENTSTKYLECVVHPYEEKQFRQIPFEIGSDIEQLEIRYRVAEGNVVDLGLQIGDSLIGWSGGARQHIVISENFATPGYQRAPIPHGRGYVLLGLHRVTNVCHIHIEIVRQRKTPRWLLGDTHLHSEHSDGKLSVESLISRANGLNFDFLCFTDHNTTSQNREIDGINSPLSLIPGMELTTTRGHANLLGVAQPIRSFLPSTTDADIADKIAEARYNGARIGINHPFCDNCPWLLPLIDYDWLELWNGPWEATTNNEVTFQYWLQQLHNGHHIAVTSGSDFHKEKSLTLPYVSVYSASQQRQDILSALAHGRSYMQSDPRIQLHQFTLGDSGIGETSHESRLHIALDVQPHHQVLLYTQNKIHELPNQNGRINQEIGCADSRFAFLRVNDARTALLITNPIFRE